MNNKLSDANAHNVVDISSSFIIWVSIYLTIYSRKTSDRIFREYPNTRLKRQELGVKIISILHAFYTGYGAYRFSDTELFDMFTKNKYAVHYANVASGFFIADLMLCIILIEEYGMQFTIHAIAALGSSILVSFTGIGQEYYMNLLLFEVSTVFLHIRSLLLEYYKKHTLLINLNNLLFMLSFGYFRIYKGIPVMYKLCLEVYNQPNAQSNQYQYIINKFIIASSVSMSILNIVWFSKILKLAFKPLFK